MQVLLQYLTLFMVGSVLGWVIELFFRRFFSTKKWINPGFLNGPYIPLYGFGVCVMYFFSNIALFWLWKILLIGAVVTLIELLAGLIFVLGMKIKLWDYSKRFLNFKGIICLEFTLIWLVLGAAFVFLLNPVFHIILRVVSFQFWTLLLGLFYGIFLVDAAVSVYYAFILKIVLKDEQATLSYESLKVYIAEELKKTEVKRSFFFPFKSRLGLKTQAKNYVEEKKRN